MTFPRPIITFKHTPSCPWSGYTYIFTMNDRAVKFVKWEGVLLVNGIPPKGEYTRSSYERMIVHVNKKTLTLKGHNDGLG
jgi:hypothetical protein